MHYNDENECINDTLSPVSKMELLRGKLETSWIRVGLF